MNLNERVEVFSKLSELIYDYFSEPKKISNNKILSDSIIKASQNNPWFGCEQIKQSLLSISSSIAQDKIHSWIKHYPKLNKVSNPKKIGIVMAGNIPLVGFMDFFYVIMSGNKALVKLSSDDNVLLPALIEILKGINHKFAEYIKIYDGILSGFDAIIATGSNNTSRYFEYYFGKYPNIIRKNRSSLAILKGDETDEELELLANDMTSYYGLGCRNVSKIFVPKNYDFDQLHKVLSKRNSILEFYKYRNNYDYRKSIFIINRTPFIDCQSLLLTENSGLSSPISVVYFDYYNSEKEITDYFEKNREEIQCVVGNIDDNKVVAFGMTQAPKLNDYADNVDVMEFLLNL